MLLQKSKSVLCSFLILSLVLIFCTGLTQSLRADSTTTVDDGGYYLRNVQSKAYVDIQNQNMANGTIIHQWAYHGFWTQRWNFEYQNNGYYTISSAVSGTKYYLSVQNGSSADGTPIVLKSGTITDSMLWAISLSSSGNYKIAPKVGESLGRCMAVVYNSNQSTNGLQIKELTYSNDGHKSDEWELWPALRELTPKHYYDTGFNVRYSNIPAQYLLEVSQTKSSERFLRTFGLYLSPSYEQFFSIADDCKTRRFGTVRIEYLNQNVSMCSHDPCCISGRTMLNHLIQNKGVSAVPSTKVLWTGHMMLEGQRSFYTTGNKAIIIMPNSTNGSTTTEIIDDYAFTIHHELSHALNAYDHYCNATATDACSNDYCDIHVYGMDEERVCVMSRHLPLDTYSDADLYCPECLGRMRNYIRENV